MAVYWKIRISTFLSDTLKAWALIAGAIVLILAWDNARRSEDADVFTGGLPWVYVVLIVTFTLIPVAYYFLRSVRGIPIAVAAILLVCEIVIAAIVSLAVVFTYLCNIGLLCP